MRYLTLLFTLFAAFNVSAKETAKLTAFEMFEQQKATILQDIKDDVIYEEIAYSDVKIVKGALDNMSVTLASVNDVSELSDDAKADLFNQQELVNTILTMAENDSRVVCRRRGRLGTNFKTTMCETVKDRRERQEADRLAIDNLIRQTPIDSN